VVFPVAPVVEKAGTFVNWEGRLRAFDAVLSTPAMTDARVLDALAAELGIALDTPDVPSIRRQLGALPATRAQRRPAPLAAPGAVPQPGDGEAILATWHQLIDLGSLQDGDEYLAGTGRTPVVRLNKSTATALGVADGDQVTVGTAGGALTLPARITEMPDRVVWLPTNSPGATVRRTLGVTAGAIVTVTGGGK
jgi:NADH-quinone oxidoreductase subunit G